MADARHTLDRLVDACRNRTAEGLRTLEDLARFVLDDRRATERLKSLRHTLAEAIARGWSEQQLLRARDVEADSGTDLQTSGESTRCSELAIATAAAGRVREGLRSLEEAAKTIDSELARSLEQLRYEATEVSGALCARLESGALRQWRLCLLLTRDACAGDWIEVVDAAVRGGVDCIQVREKHLPDAQLLEHALQVVAAGRRLGVPVIINDRCDIAMAAGAQGVHLGQDDCPVAAARGVLGPGPLIGVSTHGVDEALAAVAAGADVIGIGSIFPSTTREDLVAAGPQRIAETLAAVGQVPHLAIGGIDAHTAGQAAVAGALGVAVGAAICSAADPGAQARAIAGALAPAAAT